MLKQHAKVAEEAVAGWEKAEAEAGSLKQQLALSEEQKSHLEGRILELESSLNSCLKQSYQLQEQQQEVKETAERKLEEWDKERADMEQVQCDLRQRILESEAQCCAMAKSLEERAKAIIECQEAKLRAEMEAGLLKVKLDSQAKDMAAVSFELKVVSKELEIRNQENECCRKTADSAHKQHLEDVKKLSKLDAECRRLRSLLRKRLPGPSAVAQMKMELRKTEQTRRSLESAEVSANVHNSFFRSNDSDNLNSQIELREKIIAVEEEAQTLREALEKRTLELQQARLMYVKATAKHSAAEDQLESLEGTPKSVRSAQSTVLNSFTSFTKSTNAGFSERPEDEVSYAESWASALISELAEITKPNPTSDSGVDVIDSATEPSPKSSNKVHTDSAPMLKQGRDCSPSPQDYSTLKVLAGKDAELQSANLLCKDAIAKLSSVEIKLGNTWVSENPKSNVEESVNFVSEAHFMMSKLDKILDDMRIAVASVGDMTDDDTSDSGALLLILPKQVNDAATSTELDHPRSAEIQAKAMEELQMKISALEASKTELESQLCVSDEELNRAKCELDDARIQIEELKASGVSLTSKHAEILTEEKEKKREMQAQLEAKETEVRKLQSTVASLGVELSEQHKRNDEVISRCEELERKIQSHAERERNTMSSACRYEDESHARSRKERELAAAREKLAECEHTILMLGKQLTAFVAPSAALAYNCSKGYEDGSSCPRLNSSAHVAGESRAKPQQPHVDGNGVGFYSRPRRIHSDLSYRMDSANSVGIPGVTYSVADHLQMDDGVSSIYDSRTESAMSSPSSQYTSPSDKARVQQRNVAEGRLGAGVRTNLAKSMERVAPPAYNKRRDVGGSGGGNRGAGRAPVQHVMNTGCGGYGYGLAPGSGVDFGSGKGNKSFSRFFGRSKK
ncbi:hypothetical protein KP509_31G007400 [Ceratopteris richardii]|nr:hypothetical protein KP509_31G007400 [Ceratopteris richardii]